jgi:glycosyltransferase involved in cell wall biosynthesis
MGIILKMSFPSTKIQKDYTYQPTVSVLMPCYNEGRTVYETIESISKSNYPNDKFEVIAQDDCSVDDSYEWTLKAQRDFTNVRIRTGRNEVNSGKVRTVCNALQLSTAEVIISIDSDCIFHPDAIRELTACFAEPGIGSVGGRVGVRNPNESVITAIQTIIYYYNFATRAIDKHLGRAAADYDEWKKMKEGDVVRNMEVLRQQLSENMTVQQAKLKSLQDESEQIRKSLLLLADPDTSAALDFHNQLTASRLALEVETGDTSFRIDGLRAYLAKNVD